MSTFEANVMGKIVAQVLNEDPERLRRVLDAKSRTIGVCSRLTC